MGLAAVGLPQVLESPRYQNGEKWWELIKMAALASGVSVLRLCLKRFVARSNLSALLSDRVIALPASTSELP